MLRHRATQGRAGQITHRTDPATSAACFAAILQRNAAFLAANRSARGFILQRLLKMLAKTGDLARGAARRSSRWNPTQRATFTSAPISPRTFGFTADRPTFGFLLAQVSRGSGARSPGALGTSAVNHLHIVVNGLDE